MLNVPAPLKGEELIQGFLEVIKNPDRWTQKLLDYEAAYSKAETASKEAIAQQAKASALIAEAETKLALADKKAAELTRREASVIEKEKDAGEAYKILRKHFG